MAVPQKSSSVSDRYVLSDLHPYLDCDSYFYIVFFPKNTADRVYLCSFLEKFPIVVNLTIKYFRSMKTHVGSRLRAYTSVMKTASLQCLEFKQDKKSGQPRYFYH